MKNITKDRGFTLIEVVASIFILGLVFLGFFQLIVQSNAIAHSNNNKLVLINLADAELERIQASKFITKSELENYILGHTTQEIAGIIYKVKIELQPAKNIKNGVVTKEESIKLYNVTVTVSETNNKKNSNSIAEGYVSLE